MVRAKADSDGGGRRRSGQWRVDLKWVAGIPFTIILTLTLLILALFNITGTDNSVKSLESMNAPLLADAGLQQTLSEKAPAVAALMRQPDFARTVYDDPAVLDQAIDAIAVPPEGVAGGVTDPENPEAAAGDEAESINGLKSTINIFRAPLSLFNAGAHKRLGEGLTVFLVLLLVTGSPFILLSRRSGRFLSPGISLALASLPALMILHSMKGSLAEKIDSLALEGEAGQTGLVIDVARSFTDGVIGEAISTYRFFAIAAGGLVLGAVLFFLLRKALGHRLRPARVKPPAVA